jgi:hypothetical protein
LLEPLQSAVHHAVAEWLAVQRITQKSVDFDLIGGLPIASFEIWPEGFVETSNS